MARVERKRWTALALGQKAEAQTAFAAVVFASQVHEEKRRIRGARGVKLNCLLATVLLDCFPAIGFPLIILPRNLGREGVWIRTTIACRYHGNGHR